MTDTPERRKAIVTLLDELASVLADVGQQARSASKSARNRKQNLAIGTMLPIGPAIEDAQPRYHCIRLLHRASPPSRRRPDRRQP